MKNKPLKGVRVGIVREFMVKHVKNDVAISDQIDKEIKAVLRDSSAPISSSRSIRCMRTIRLSRT